MQILGCLSIGYALGALSPAALLGHIKKKNLRQEGTNNLGASNVLMSIGKAAGVFVMLFDIFKAFFAAKLAKLLFPQLALAGLLAGFAAVVGHVFPFYLKFRGGKGLATFGGMILAYDYRIFLLMLALCLVLMILVNHSYAMPMSAAVLFPILAGIHSKNIWVIVIATAAGLLIAVKHWSNIEKGRSGKEKKIRDFIKEDLFSRK